MSRKGRLIGFERILQRMSDRVAEVKEKMLSADAQPADVGAQIAAAYACDRYGTETDAIRYYDAAWALGVPDDQRRRFMVGYGSTLRNVGRVTGAVDVLRQSITESPEYAPHHAFLALALHDLGEHDAALGSALTALLEAGAVSLDGYDRALSYYRDVLTSAIRRDHSEP